MKNLKWITLIITAFAIGYFFSGSANDNHDFDSGTTGQPTTWTCSMHPNVKLPNKGQCPICFMDLIPLEAGAGSGSDPILKMSPSAEKLAEIMITAVVRSEAFSEIRVTGKLDVDETQVRDIASWMDGRIERLYVDFTGISVRKDDHLLDIYSPGLIAAQEEFLAAYQAGSGFGISASREKLRLLGVSKSQIKNLEKSGKVKEALTIHTPISGVVIDKNAQEGEYVKTGQHLYSVADLSRLWLLMDIFESDIGYIYLGQPVEFKTTAYPGKTFNGTVAFIAPILDPATRTVKVRVNVNNDKLQLKPEMLAVAVISSQLDAEGTVVHTELKGKWLCPMHPDDVHNSHGQCRICGMDLVKAESIPGAVTADIGKNPLLIPETAVLKTGKRSIVYVRTQTDGNAAFEGRVVKLGPKTGNQYIVLDGLSENESVVTNGAFKIDSALQIEAKPAMMSPVKEELIVEIPDAGTLNHDQYEIILPIYLQLQEALAGDNFQSAQSAYHQIIKSGKEFFTLEMNAGKSIETIRTAFHPLSQSMIMAADSHQHGYIVNEAFCPMAFDNTGASWLQTTEKIANPYFGSKMLRCGTLKNKFGGDHGQ
ncbi:MAG: efflux RND transporter periplasmic adaptor subunit [Candidatus Marinimicrobia bacterium]|nr:efflux RND transporter periplasmic adaptor subunit [Candidatus Neomarinimicrobiota bacterium]